VSILFAGKLLPHRDAAMKPPWLDAALSEGRPLSEGLTSQRCLHSPNCSGIGNEFAPENYRFRFLVRTLRFPPTLGFTSGLAVRRAMAPPIRRQVTLSARSTKGPHSLAR
jgi:hypothetical protein